MAGLNGEYRHKLDAKGRLSLPSSIRKLLTEETQMVVVPDARNEFLSVYTNEAFDVWIDTLFEKRGGFDPNKREHMLLNSILRGNATPVTMDSAGRITLPQSLRERAGIDKEVTLVGAGSHFDTFVDSTLGGAGHSSEVAKRLGEGGLLIGIDQDEMALAAAKKRLSSASAENACEVMLLRGNFGDLDELLVEAQVPGIDAILFDIGVSSVQIDTPSRSGKTPCWTCEWTRVDKP